MRGPLSFRAPCYCAALFDRYLETSRSDTPARLARLPVLIPLDKADGSRQRASTHWGFSLRLFGGCKLWMTRRKQLTIAVELIACFTGETRAQGPPARAYLNTPVDQLRFLVDLVGSNGTTVAESDLPLPNFATVSRYGFLSLLWSIPLAGRYGGVQVGAGRATVEG